MEPTADELAAVAAKIESGALRHDAPEKTWGGMGNGRHCDGCGLIVAKVDLEIELDFDEGQTTLRLHLPCFKEWLRAAENRRRSDVERG